MDDNTFECPQCGAVVYPEMTRCPSCGHNMYPEDDQPLPVTTDSETSTLGSAVGSILVGLLIASAIALIFHFVVASFSTPQSLGVAGVVILFLAGPLGALAGGYVIGGLKPDHAVWFGGLIGLLSLPLLLLFATHWVKVTASFLINPIVLSSGLATVMTGLVGGWLYIKLSVDKSWKERWQVRGWEDLLYQDLLRKVRFNGSTADRLIEYERKQDPDASRLKLIQNAIARWERDNR
jgi:RNA polymerase subunit RPABC4/transcription elongation factor Spt4